MEIAINITFTTSEGVHTLSFDEAKELYSKLGEILNDKPNQVFKHREVNPSVIRKKNIEPYIPPDSEETIKMMKEAKDVAEVAKSGSKSMDDIIEKMLKLRSKKEN